MLDNLKHEMFCQLVARGTALPWAYRGAGYPPNPEAATSLARKPMMRDRIAELWPDFEKARSFVERKITYREEWEE